MVPSRGKFWERRIGNFVITSLKISVGYTKFYRLLYPARLSLFGTLPWKESKPTSTQNYQGPNRSIEPSLYVRQSLYHTVPVVKILSGHVHVENADGQFADNLSNVNRLIDFLLFFFLSVRMNL